MDRAKAIKVLKPLVDSYVDYANITMKEEDDDIVEALEMAIEALKALDVPDMNVGDMISRQAAIDALARMMPRSYTPDGSHPADEEIFRAQEVFADCIEALEILPSAQPEERKKGAWILGFDNQYLEKYYYCSNCGCRKYTEDEPSDYFCSKCGADMRGGEKE